MEFEYLFQSLKFSGTKRLKLGMMHFVLQKSKKKNNNNDAFDNVETKQKQATLKSIHRIVFFSFQILY